MYKIQYEKRAEKALEKIHPPFYFKIKDAVEELKHNPRPFGSKKLKDREAYRIRVGDFRIIYEIADKILIVYIIDIGDRKEIYK